VTIRDKLSQFTGVDVKPDDCDPGVIVEGQSMIIDAASGDQHRYQPWMAELHAMSQGASVSPLASVAEPSVFDVISDYSLP